MTEESFKNQPGQLSLSLRCVSSISTQKQDDAHTIETHHQKDSVHFSYGSLFFSGIYSIIHLFQNLKKIISILKSSSKSNLDIRPILKQLQLLHPWFCPFWIGFHKASLWAFGFVIELHIVSPYHNYNTYLQKSACVALDLIYYFVEVCMAIINGKINTQLIRSKMK